MEQDTRTTVLADLEAGRMDAARASLRPDVLKAVTAPDAEVYYLLGRTFFGADNATARYLFEHALSIEPGFEDAARYEARCGSAIHDLEDFNGPRHRPCDYCTLHFREQESRCPYCGSPVDRAGAKADDSIEGQFREVGEEVLDSIRTFAEREDVKQAREKLSAAGKHVYGKARAFGESDRGKGLKATARAMGTVAARRASALGKRKEVQSAREQASKMGSDARDKAKAFSEREDVQKNLGKARAKSKGLINRAQAFVRREQMRFNAGDSKIRAVIVAKWFVAGLIVLWIANWIFGD